MSVSLDYQLVYNRRGSIAVSVHWQIVAVVLLIVSLGLRIWLKIENTDLGYELARERQTTVALDMERREMDLQLSVLLRPDSLQREASSRLGLAPLKTGQAKKISYQ